MAAMLDMAFQLLAFFILTFQPSEIETQISMRMPQEKVQSQGATTEVDPNPPPDVEEELGLPLIITVNATPDGDIARITVGPNAIQSDTPESLFATLEGQVSKMLSELSIERIQLSVDEALRYEGLMYVVDVCARQKLPNGERMTKISISAIK
jgi:biopolymer transport protein ExbD